MATSIGSNASTGLPEIKHGSDVIMTVSQTTGEVLFPNGVDSNFIKGALNASGSAPIYACRAWVNFNGTGTVAIRASGNVSSITDNGTGNYTVNFTTAMPDVNYDACHSIGRSTINYFDRASAEYYASRTTTSMRIYTGYSSSTFEDSLAVEVSVFR